MMQVWPMSEVIMTMLVFFAVITITACVFGGWVIFNIFRLLARFAVMMIEGFSGMWHRRRPLPRPMMSSGDGDASAGRMCPNDRCRAMNPPQARFCRRCGRALPATQPVAVRRVACW
jgi:hypothetical protein